MMLDFLGTGDAQQLITIFAAMGVAIGGGIAAYRGYKAPDRRGFPHKPLPITNSIDALIVQIKQVSDQIIMSATKDDVKKIHNHIGQLKSDIKDCKELIKRTEDDLRTFHEADILKIEKLSRIENQVDKIATGVAILEAKH
jgi:hypothetical protein